MNEIIIVRQDEGAPLLHLQAVLTTGDWLTAVHLGGLEVLAFLHARPDRVCIRLVFLNQQLKLPVVLLCLLVKKLISPDTLAASQHILPHIQGAIQIVRTRKPVKQIQKWVGITKRKVQIAQIHIRKLCPLFPSNGEAQAHGLRVRESKALFGPAVWMTGVHSPQRFGRIP